jgi:uncharacterized membrane protein YdjX (TVP38/TMEM64 family)
MMDAPLLVTDHPMPMTDGRIAQKAMRVRVVAGRKRGRRKDRQRGACGVAIAGFVPARMTWLKRILWVLGVALLALVAWSVWDHRDALMGWKEEAGPVKFFAAMAVLPALGVPITPLFVLAGATFGVGPGLLGSGVALGLNLILCYGIARSALRPWLESLLGRFEYELPDFKEREGGALRFTLLVKFAPGAPAVAKNYLLGLTGVPFPLYFGASMLITGVYAVLCVVVGGSLFEHDVGRVLLAAAIVAVLGGGLWWWRKRVGRREAGDAAGGAAGVRGDLARGT